MEEGPGLELRQENKGLKGFQGCDRDTLGCVHILATVNSAAVNIQFSHSVMSDFATPWTAARQASLSITNSQSLLQLMSIELVVPPNHLIPVVSFSSCLQSFQALGSFLMSLLFISGGQSIGVSASTSVLQVNIQD